MNVTDDFFMACVTMKHGGTWDFMDWMFQMNGSTLA